MTTPIVLLILLTAPYLFARLLASSGRRGPDPKAAAAVGLGLVFLFTASGHFVQTEPMAQMLPAWVPGRTPLVYLTGVLEIAIAIGFFIPRHRHLAGLSAVAVLILFFPANIYAALHQVPMGGHAWGPVYLLVRAPLQLILVVWAWWFTLRRAVTQGAPLERRAGAARS